MVGASIKVNGAEQAVGQLVELRERWSEDAKWIVGVGAEYGAYVEFGTSRNQAQPYLFPAVQRVMRSEFGTIEAQSNSMEELVSRLAYAIERHAKVRAPVDTGFLRSSIEANPAGSYR